MLLNLSKMYKKIGKSAKVLLSLVICLVIVAASLPFITSYSAEIPETELCNDNFDREDADSAGNGWQDLTAGNSKIANNQLVVKAGAMENTLLNRIQRPMSEASINQKVSVEFTVEDLIAGKRPLIWLRSQNDQTTGVAGYFLTWEGNGSGSGSNIRIYKRTSDSTGFTMVAEQMYNINFTNGSWTGTMRFDVSVSGTYPTKFNVTAYSKSLNWEANWDIGSDSTPELQNAGTTGISAFTVSGEDAEMTFDNFKYSAADIKRTVSLADDKFNRADSDTVGNGWEYTDGIAKIADNKLALTTGVNSANGTDGYISNVITRPEVSTDQSVTVEVSCEDIAAGKLPAIWLRVQDDGINQKGYALLITDGSYRWEIGLWWIDTSSANSRQYLGNHRYITKTYFSGTAAGDSLVFTISAKGTNPTDITIGSVFKRVGWSVETNHKDSTAAFQTEGKVGLSAISSSTKNTTVFDNFAYATSIDGTPLLEKISEAEVIVKSGIGYTKESIELIKEEIEKANEVIKNIRNVSATELNNAMASLQAALDTALPLPEMTSIKINGNALKEVTYNSYNITVGKDINSLDFEVIAENSEDIVKVKSDKTGVEGLTQEFTGENSESYTVTITSSTHEEAVSTFGVTVYRSESAFVEFTDDFERPSGILGNGWIEETQGIASIFDGNMSISCGGVTSSDDIYKNRVIRPYEESTVDQFMTVDVPVETLRNGIIPRFWLRLQEDGDDNPLNNDGYFVQVNFLDGISVGKRVGGVETQLHKLMYRPNLSLYQGVFHFEIMIRGTDTTDIRIRIQNDAESDGGKKWRVSEICKDTENPITNKGTVGLSYSASKSDYLISDFYYCDYKQPNYMLHVKGQKKIGYFGQWLDLDPNETYVYSYDVHVASDLGDTMVMPTLQYANEGSNPYDFFYFEDYNRDKVKQTFSGTFNIPADALKQLDGKVAVRIGFTTGVEGAEAYIHNMKVYKQSDETQTNLFQNADFSRALYGWMANGKAFEPVVSEAALASSSNDVELEKYDASLFGEDAGAENVEMYPEHKGEFMIYSNGVNAWQDFSQSVNVKPGETYMFSYYYNFIANNWIQPYCNFYTGDTEESKRLTFEYKQTDAQNCIITCEFLVPENSKLNPDGTTTIYIGINMGQQGSMAYFYKPMLYVKSDANKTNLLYNSDFKRGLEGWTCAAMGTYKVSIPDVYFAPFNSAIEVLPADLSYFNLGDVASDGEWWREFYPNGLPGSDEALGFDKEEEKPEIEDTNKEESQDKNEDSTDNSEDEDFTIDFEDEESTDNSEDEDFAIDFEDEESTDNSEDEDFAIDFEDEEESYEESEDEYFEDEEWEESEDEEWDEESDDEDFAIDFEDEESESNGETEDNSQPENNEQTDNSTPEKENNNITLIIIIAVVSSVVIIGGAVTFLILKKRKP